MSEENDLGNVITEEDNLTPVEKTPEELEIEAQARRMGWRPKEEFDRPPARWVDAQTFVDRGMQELPVLRDRYRRLDQQMATTTEKLTAAEHRLTETTQVLNEVRELARNAEDRAYIRALRDISTREREAVAAADTAAFEQLQRERQDLEQTRPKPAAAAPVAVAPPAPTAPAAPPAPPPAVQAWMARNTWFNTDPVLTNLATGLDMEIKRNYPEWSVEEQLAEVERQVKTRFPEKFGTPRRQAPPAVLTGSGAPARPKGKTLKDMPKEYQDAFARFKRMMPDYTEAEYLKTVGEM